MSLCGQHLGLLETPTTSTGLSSSSRAVWEISFFIPRHGALSEGIGCNTCKTFEINGFARIVWQAGRTGSSLRIQIRCRLLQLIRLPRCSAGRAKNSSRQKACLVLLGFGKIRWKCDLTLSRPDIHARMATKSHPTVCRWHGRMLFGVLRST